MAFLLIFEFSNSEKKNKITFNKDITIILWVY